MNHDVPDEVPCRKTLVDKPAPRKTPGVCPLCQKLLKRNSGGTRFVPHCDACGGTLNKDILCPHCGAFRVWTGRLGAVCHGCGKAVARRPKARSAIRGRLRGPAQLVRAFHKGDVTFDGAY